MVTQGDALQELVDNVKEAIELYLETLTEDEKKDLLQQRVVGIQKVKTLSKIQPLSPQKLIKTLQKAGFKVVRQ